MSAHRKEEAGNSLAFRTPVGGQSLQAGESMNLTEDFPNGVNVRPYQAIRIAGGSRTSSEGNVTLSIIMTIKRERFVTLDTIEVSPGQAFNNVYQVPGLGIEILAKADMHPGPATIDVAVFGYNPERK
ncbi:hypothetical protein RB620_14105 [Paenibacillus sp. LHD-117]|uniref:hypothetical protein n=1 Tax=Paenibacillus sp. LHD-117 TaxID=3071412 RepID=UPI0027E0E90F|nr:hypothetical protein [Paenibacillus sp. LHD-117]MDQ6420559.1 hypothetical protein [Paenibacillus sp. LHD-117]